MNFTITVEPDNGTEIENVLVSGLVAYNTARAGSSNYRALFIALRDGAGNICGGISGTIHWNWLFIKLLWVSEEGRGQGFGTSLMAAAEQEALTHGCTHAYLDTFSFQARGFYESLGYKVFGQLEDFPPGQTRCFLQKRLTSP